MNENEMTDLELDIVTDLAEYASDNLSGRDFWVEVSRLLAFGEDYAEEMYSKTY